MSNDEPIITRRIAEHSQVPTYNAFPDLPIVSMAVVTDHHVAYQLGSRTAYHNHPRIDQLPAELVTLLRDEGGYRYLDAAGAMGMAPAAGWSLVPPYGQAHSPNLANLVCVFSGLRLVRVELGCHHAFVEKTLGRAWHSYTCSTCGYWYEVDSSD